MKFLHVSLQDFRNLALVRRDLSAPRTFLVGKNGQGKSNFLEALGFLSALRSFRVSEIPPLIREGMPSARMIYHVAHEHAGEQEIEVEIRRGKKRVLLNGERVATLSSMIGRFPVVTLSSEDMEYLRGNPGHRRRFLDLILSILNPEYLRQLKRYAAALQERNRLLKRRHVDASQCEAFEAQMAPAAAALVRLRRQFLMDFRKDLEVIYNRISSAEEAPELHYRMSCEIEAEVSAFRGLFREERGRDTLLGNTRSGPHRDDFQVRLLGRAARAYASEGQKRGLVVAIRLAECVAIHRVLGIRPVLVADDIVGELHPERRSNFWKCLDPGMQVVASGTSLPDRRFASWNLIEVRNGELAAAPRESLQTGEAS